MHYLSTNPNPTIRKLAENVEFGWRGSGDIAEALVSLKTKLRVVPASGLKNLFGPRLL